MSPRLASATNLTKKLRALERERLMTAASALPGREALLATLDASIVRCVASLATMDACSSPA